MGELPLEDRHLYFFQFNSQPTAAKYTFAFHQPLKIVNEKTHLLDIVECIFPEVRVLVSPGFVVVNRGKKLRVAATYIASLAHLVDCINEVLPEGFTPLRYLSRDDVIPLDRVQLVLLPNQSLQVSGDYANLLFEGKKSLTNKTTEKVTYNFKAGKRCESNTYYLTCDLVGSVNVDKSQKPLINTLIINQKTRGAHSKLKWKTEDTPDKVYLRSGYHSSITIQVLDEKENLVELTGGLVFLHMKLCT